MKPIGERPWHRGARAAAPVVALAETVVAALLGVAGPPGAVHAADPPRVSIVQDLARSASPASGPDISIRDPDFLVVGWTVPVGATAERSGGVHVRRRRGGHWDPIPIVIREAEGTSPRDLQVACGAEGQIHLVWSAVNHAGPGRLITGSRVRYAELGPYGTIARGPIALASPSEPGPGGDPAEEFPRIISTAGEGALVSWERTGGLWRRIESALIPPDPRSAPRPLTSVSGPRTSLLSAWPVSVRPAVIAWFEFDGTDALLHESDNGGGRNLWQVRRTVSESRSGLPLSLRPRPLSDAGNSVLLAWGEDTPGGGGRIGMGRVSGDEVRRGGVRTTDGAPRGVTLLPLGGQRYSLTWITQRPEGHSVGAMDVHWSTDEPLILNEAEISAGRARFPSEPAQATLGNTTALVWCDSIEAGGSGTLGFAEIEWQAGRSSGKSDPPPGGDAPEADGVGEKDAAGGVTSSSPTPPSSRP